ncbi:MAG: AAA-like domain-containing protein [Fimbriimonas sp.]
MAVVVLDQPTFFVTGGTLPPAAPSYIVRQADRDLLENMAKGEFCYVLNARQMGKSSLSVRTMAQLNEKGIKTVFIDLTKLGGRNVTSDQWYAGLLSEIGRSLGLRAEFLKYFTENKELGAMQRFFGAIREVALATIAEPICIFIDEVDATRALSFSADEFFAGIRECYNRRVLDPEYQRLTFCLLGVASPSDLIQDVRTTPFNIGKNITLKDFSLEEALQLEEGLGKNAHDILKRILYWTDGHPYLTQNLCASVAQRGIDTAAGVDRLVNETFFEKKARMAHVNLADVANRVLNGFESADKIDAYRAEILQLYAKIRAKKQVQDDSSSRLQTVLRLSGLVTIKNGMLVPRNRIYETVFDTEWIEENMPGKELRRQKRAYRRGILRATSIAGVIVIAMAALAGYSVLMAKRANDSNELAKYELYVANVELMETAWEENNIDRLRELLAITKDHPARGWEWGHWERLAHLDELSIKDPEQGYGPAYSPDGKEIVMRYPTKLSFYDAETGKTLRSFPMERRSLGYAIWTPDGRAVLDAATDEGLFLYDAQTGKQLVEIPAAQHSCSLRPFSPDGRLLASSPSDFAGHQNLTVWDTATGKLKKEIKVPGRQVQAATFSPNGKLLAGVYLPRGIGNFGVFTYDLATSKLLKEIPTKGLPTSTLFSPDGTKLAVGSSGGWLEVFDSRTGSPVASLQAHRGNVNQFDWSKNGRFIATVGSDRICKIWELRNSKLVLENSIRGAGLVNFAPHGKRILAGFFDIRVFDTYLHDESDDYSTPMGLPGRVRVDPTGKLALFDGGIVQQMDTSVYRASPLPDLPSSGLVSDDGKYVLAGQPGKDWALVRAGEWRPLMKLSDLTSQPVQVNVSSNGDRAAVLFDDRSVAVYAVANGAKVAAFNSNERFTAADLSPDGKTLLTGSLWGDVKFWSVDGAVIRYAPKAHSRTVWCVTYSADGSRAITTSDDHTARVWDAATGKESLLLEGHSQAVLDAGFSPDMKRILTASRDLTTRVWDAATRRELIVLDGNQGEVLSAQFMPNGKDIVTASADGLIRVWASGRRKQIEVGR